MNTNESPTIISTSLTKFGLDTRVQTLVKNRSKFGRVTRVHRTVKGSFFVDAGGASRNRERVNI